jgi:hypothetical protein
LLLVSLSPSEKASSESHMRPVQETKGPQIFVHGQRSGGNVQRPASSRASSSAEPISTHALPSLRLQEHMRDGDVSSASVDDFNLRQSDESDSTKLRGRGMRHTVPLHSIIPVQAGRGNVNHKDIKKKRGRGRGR